MRPEARPTLLARASATALSTSTTTGPAGASAPRKAPSGDGPSRGGTETSHSARISAGASYGAAADSRTAWSDNGSRGSLVPRAASSGGETETMSVNAARVMRARTGRDDTRARAIGGAIGIYTPVVCFRTARANAERFRSLTTSGPRNARPVTVQDRFRNNSVALVQRATILSSL
jgi:hypothetical protein